jgi:hypothetical protein
MIDESKSQVIQETFRFGRLEEGDGRIRRTVSPLRATGS